MAVNLIRKLLTEAVQTGGTYAEFIVAEDKVKLMNNRYVLVEKKGLTSTYEGVFVDDTSHKIYLLLDTYKAHKDVFMKNTIILRDSSKNQNMEVRIAGITELRS